MIQGRCTGRITGTEYDFIMFTDSQPFYDEMNRRGFKTSKEKGIITLFKQENQYETIDLNGEDKDAVIAVVFHEIQNQNTFFSMDWWNFISAYIVP